MLLDAEVALLRGAAAPHAFGAVAAPAPACGTSECCAYVLVSRATGVPRVRAEGDAGARPPPRWCVAVKALRDAATGNPAQGVTRAAASSSDPVWCVSALDRLHMASRVGNE